MNEHRQNSNFRSTLPAENHPVGDHGAGVKMMGSPPAPQPRPMQSAKNQKSNSARKRSEIDEQQRRPAVGIADQPIAPWQAGDDDDRKRDQADGAVDEDGIGRGAPARAGSRNEPEPYRVAADRGGQGLVKECSDHVEA